MSGTGRFFVGHQVYEMRPGTLIWQLSAQRHRLQRGPNLELWVAQLYEDILGVQVRKAVIAVDAGRNLAVLVEAAVRNTILQLRGIDTYQEFIERHQRAMQKTSE